MFPINWTRALRVSVLSQDTDETSNKAEALFSQPGHEQRAAVTTLWTTNSSVQLSKYGRKYHMEAEFQLDPSHTSFITEHQQCVDANTSHWLMTSRIFCGFWNSSRRAKQQLGEIKTYFPFVSQQLHKNKSTPLHTPNPFTHFTELDPSIIPHLSKVRSQRPQVMKGNPDIITLPRDTLQLFPKRFQARWDT